MNTKNLQEILNEIYPTDQKKSEVKEIIVGGNDWEWEVDNNKVLNKKLSVVAYENKTELLDLTKFLSLEKLVLDGRALGAIVSNVDLSECRNLVGIIIRNNELTSVDLLKNLPCPDKLQTLDISNNNIKETNLDVFKTFINLRQLNIGTYGYSSSTEDFPYNRFYGSLESLAKVSNLGILLISETDVEKGLEYLPLTLFAGKGQNYFYFNQRSIRKEAKVKLIEKELERYGGSIIEWQMDHLEETLNAQLKFMIGFEEKKSWLDLLEIKMKRVLSMEEGIYEIVKIIKDDESLNNKLILDRKVNYKKTNYGFVDTSFNNIQLDYVRFSKSSTISQYKVGDFLEIDPKILEYNEWEWEKFIDNGIVKISPDSEKLEKYKLFQKLVGKDFSNLVNLSLKLTRKVRGALINEKHATEDVLVVQEV
ncbi:MAG: hypothetical protein MRERC_1c038 [Mycoplasmataceae bacterium RC_NB112A]|nr:MAG: hypothetical protein MRERC_1c038 [Mycoplasmataceae bacterium RC_NB112A]